MNTTKRNQDSQPQDHGFKSRIGQSDNQKRSCMGYRWLSDALVHSAINEYLQIEMAIVLGLPMMPWSVWASIYSTMSWAADRCITGLPGVIILCKALFELFSPSNSNNCILSSAHDWLAICLFQAFSKVSRSFDPMLQGCQSNRDQWLNLSRGRQKKQEDENHQEHPDKQDC